MASLQRDIKRGLAREPSPKRTFSDTRTSDVTLSLNQTGYAFNNRGASGAVTFTLPSSKVKGLSGYRYTFTVLTEQDVTIDPGSGYAIYMNGEKLSDGTTLTSSVVGETITLESDGNQDWYVIERVGNWSGSDFATQSISGNDTATVDTRHLSLTTTGAGTLTVPDGVPGQMYSINLVTDGGTATVAPSSAKDFVSVALADAGDQVTMQYYNATDGWVLVGATGVAAPPAVALS